MSRYRASLVVVLMCGSLQAQSVSSPLIDFATAEPVLYPSYLTEHDGLLYFRGRLAAEGSVTGLWYSDGAYAYHVSGTGTGGTVTEPSYLASFGTHLLFAGSQGGTKLWQYSRDEGLSLAPGGVTAGSSPQELIAYDNKLYFRATRFSDIGIELWTYDGESQSPIDIYPGSGSSFPQHFIEYDGQLYFNANGTPGQGSELFRYNGFGLPTEAARIFPNDGSSPEHLAVFQDDLYFSAYDGLHGRELWRYNGASGATLAADIVSGDASDSSNPSGLCAFNGKLYFSATDGVHGYELWAYDPSIAPSAQMVAEINATPDPGDGSDPVIDSSPAELTVLDGLLYFSADDGIHGRELWSFDGAIARLVADINPGPYGSEVSELTVFDRALYFSADDGYVPGLTSFVPKTYRLTVPEPRTFAAWFLGVVFSLARARRPATRRCHIRRTDGQHSSFL